ncbi:PREDICTED: TRAF-type zinc finger domain-containing protein 1, partial [Pterocles gutturalis]|uniref:TRAF-type zinc finger domain-containing protein 1 n=1 Tax=Pterocles gutturalis TaxID=240206 RepID=UPI0005294DD0
KKDIPLANFIVHEIHCSRNIEVCRYCSESIPKSEIKNHMETEHAQVTCKCQMKIEKRLLDDHEASGCLLRPAVCQYCDIQLTFNKLQDHEIYCGARTETCGGCGRNIMVKDLKEHPQICGQEAKQVRESRRVPRFEDEDADLHTLRDIRNRLRSGNSAGLLGRMPTVLEKQIYSRRVEDKTLKDISRRNVSAAQRTQRREAELEQLERNEDTHSSLDEEWNADLDYALALSLQNENDPHNNAAAAIPSDFWENYYTKGTVPSGCLSETDKSSIFSCDSSVPFSTSNHAKKGEIMIPCEFCGIQLEEETVFHHQHHCDLRPASPAASSPPRQLLSPQANRERREAPELALRRIRHQGDVSPRRIEGFGQQRLSNAARGTKSLNNVANARNTPLSSSMRANNAPDARGKPRKVAGNEGRPKNRGGSETADGTTPRARPTQNLHSEAFTSSFSRTSATQLSTSNAGGRSLGLSHTPVSFRRRNTKAKAQSPASDYPEQK